MIDKHQELKESCELILKLARENAGELASDVERGAELVHAATEMLLALRCFIWYVDLPEIITRDQRLRYLIDAVSPAKKVLKSLKATLDAT